MKLNHRGKQSIIFPNHPSILGAAAIAGKKEAHGPLCSYFDFTNEDTKFGQESWEKAESKMQELALGTARDKAHCHNNDIDFLFAGDLLNQCIGSSFSSRGTDIPFVGLYGACSTMAEGLALSSMCVDGGYATISAALTSSHFAGAERQYRFPLAYGGQRTPTAQWTVTAAGCLLLGTQEKGPYVNAATFGQVVDYGICDANNMGAAMAPAAYTTLRAHFDDLSMAPEDYDLIVTGDLGRFGKEIVLDLFAKDGVALDRVYDDCGCMIFDTKKQDTHAGGSGCGCSAAVLCGYIMHQLYRGKLKHVLFCGTGALLSPLTCQQGETIPCICHAVSIGTERR